MSTQDNVLDTKFFDNKPNSFAIIKEQYKLQNNFHPNENENGLGVVLIKTMSL